MASSFSIPLFPEILHMICEQLISHKSTLANLARTSKAFEEPALDVLWFKLAELYPLAKCLPSNLWAEKTRKVKDRKVRYIALLQPLLAEDCTRFSRYAKRVHDFSILGCGQSKPRVDGTALQGLQVVMYSAKILPNVQRLQWDWYDDSELPFTYMLMFLGPRLTKVDVAFSKSSILPVSIFPMLGQICPSLKHISFIFAPVITPNTGAEEIRITEIISSSIYNWNDLELLTVSNLTYEALLHVSKFPQLRYLTVTLWKPDFFYPNLRNDRFPALNSLSLSTVNATDAIAFLELLDMSPAQSMQPISYDDETSETWEKLFVTLSRGCSHDTFRFLECVIGREQRNSAISTFPSRYGSIRPLLVFRNLELLSIDFSEGFQISDPAATKEMATSWPNLKSLIFIWPLVDLFDRATSITLVDLIPFAEHCPMLEELCIFINATNPPDICDQKPGDRISQKELTHLYVGPSPACNSTLIAAFLSSWFSSLQVIIVPSLDAEDATENEEEWLDASSELLPVSMPAHATRSTLTSALDIELDRLPQYYSRSY